MEIRGEGDWAVEGEAAPVCIFCADFVTPDHDPAHCRAELASFLAEEATAQRSLRIAAPHCLVPGVGTDIGRGPIPIGTRLQAALPDAPSRWPMPEGSP
jgi:hypothetical protein